MAVTHAYSSPIADATGTQTIWYGATTQTVAATDNIRPSNWNEAHAQLVTLAGNTVGVSVVTGTNIVFGGSNNVTLSGIQGANAGTINISAAGGGGGGGSVNISAGTTSNNLTNFVFSNGNGVSFGLNGSTVTATVQTNYLTTAQPVGAYLTTARASNDAIGLNTAQSNVTWTVNSSGLSLDARGYAGSGYTSTTTAGTAIVGTQNSAGLSLGVPQFLTTAQPVGAYLTTARASNDAVGLNSAGTNVTWTVNSSGISINASGYAGSGFTSTTTAGTAVVGTHNSAGLSMAFPSFITNAITTARASNDAIGLNTAQSNVTWTVNSSGLSLDARGYAGTATGATNASVTVNSGGVSVSVGNYITTARGSTDAIGLNTAQSNVTWTVNSSGLSLDARGYAGTGTTFNGANVSGSITLNSAGLQLSLSGATAAPSPIGVSAGTTSASLGNLVFSNSNGVSFGLNGSTITASVAGGGIGAGVSNLGNTAGSTGTVTTGNVVFVGSNGITLSQSTGAAGSAATITVLGVGGMMSSYWGPDGHALTFLAPPTNASVSVNMFQIPHGLTATRVELPVYQSLSSTNNANTYGQQWSIYVMVLTNDSANSRLMSVSSGSTQTTYTVASNTAGQTQLLGSGVRPVSCPVNLSMTPGQYFVALNWVTNTFSSGTATTSLNRTVSILGNPTNSASYAMVADYSAATGNTNNSFMPAGVFSAASTGIPATISYSQMTMTGSSRSQANFALLFRG